MKRWLLPLLFLILNYSLAQPYLPMLEDNTTWSVDIHYCVFGGACPYVITEQISLENSYVFNGKTYKRVQNNQGLTSCYVREENGVVYKYFEPSNDEYVLLDFTLELGDVFDVFNESGIQYCSVWGENNTGIDMLEVVNVETQFIAGENRKVIEFDLDNTFQIPEIWIEGIGSSSGFDPIGYTVDVSDYTRLVCYTKNGVTTFFNGATSCDNTVLNVAENKQSAIILAPNPVHDISILRLHSELKIDQLRIYDLSGKLVSEENITKDYTTINAMDFASGLYFYQVVSNSSVLKTDRFVVR